MTIILDRVTDRNCFNLNYFGFWLEVKHPDVAKRIAVVKHSRNGKRHMMYDDNGKKLAELWEEIKGTVYK